MSEHHNFTIKTLVSTALALAVLTILTVALAYIHITPPFNLIIAVGIAAIKASLVILFFMNLYYESKFNLLLFIFSILFFVIIVGITLLDTLFRIDPIPAF